MQENGDGRAREITSGNFMLFMSLKSLSFGYSDEYVCNRQCKNPHKDNRATLYHSSHIPSRNHFCSRKNIAWFSAIEFTHQLWQRKEKEVLIKFWFLKWANWCGSHRWWINTGHRIVIWQPVLLTNLRGICCYLVWCRANTFWAAVSHLRGLIVS